MKKKIKQIMKCFLIFSLGNFSFFVLKKSISGNSKKKENKDKRYYQLFDNWLNIIDQGNTISDYFINKNIKMIAIYGYGKIGKHLVAQLSKTDISVNYIIDKKNIATKERIDCYHIADDMPKVDAIIITPILEYQEIKNVLQKNSSAEIISVEDIIYELL